MIKNHMQEVFCVKKEAAQIISFFWSTYHPVTISQIVLSIFFLKFHIVSNRLLCICVISVAKLQTGEAFLLKNGSVSDKRKSERARRTNTHSEVVQFLFFLLCCAVDCGTSGKQCSYDYTVHVSSIAGGMEGEVKS